MARTAIATLQPVWECRWSRLQAPLTPTAQNWVCVHDGEPCAISEKDCQTCPYWEKSPAAAAGTAAAHESLSLRPSSLLRPLALLRGIVLLNALVFLVCGFVILTHPLWIPATIALWACAAVLVGFATSQALPDEHR